MTRESSGKTARSYQDTTTTSTAAAGKQKGRPFRLHWCVFVCVFVRGFLDWKNHMAPNVCACSSPASVWMCFPQGSSCACAPVLAGHTHQTIGEGTPTPVRQRAQRFPVEVFVCVLGEQQQKRETGIFGRLMFEAIHRDGEGGESRQYGCYILLLWGKNEVPRDV